MKDRSRPPVLLLVLLLAGAPGCGGGATQDRPEVVATEPGREATVAFPVAGVRLTFDEPVRLLNTTQVLGYAGPTQLPVSVEVLPPEGRSLLVRPTGGAFFQPGIRNTVQVSPGLVVNEKDHYALEPFVVGFVPGPEGSVHLASRAGARVVAFDGETFAPGAGTPTPGGRAPVGLAGTHLSGAPRLWVQLAGGGAGNEPLAFFAPGDAAMTAVALASPAGTTLVADAKAMGVAPDGLTLYTAWREEPTGVVRLARVDVASGLELLPSLVLSPPAAPGTRPRGLVVARDGQTLHVAVETGTGARLVEVGLGSFAERDLDGALAGVQGLPLSSGAGPVDVASDLVLVAPVAATTADLTAWRRGTGATIESSGTPTGAPARLLVTREDAWILEGLAGHAAGEGLVARRPAGLSSPVVVAVSDDVGGASAGTSSVTALAAYPASLRLVAVLDGSLVARLAWTAEGFEQHDLDAGVPGVQVIDVSADVTDVVDAAFVPGVLPR